MFISAVVFLLFISGCANTANEKGTVQEDYSDYTGQIALTNEPEYSSYATSMTNALRQSKACIVSNTENLNFKDNLNVYIPTSVYRVLARIVGNFDKEYGNELLRKLVGYGEWNDKYYTSAEDRGPYYAYGPEYSGILSDGRQVYACVWCTGSCFFHKGNGMDGISGNYNKEINYLSLTQDANYTFPGTDLSLDKALSIANSYVKDFYSPTDVEVEFRPNYIRITGTDEQTDFICIIYQVVYRGAAITDVTDHRDNSNVHALGYTKYFAGPCLVLDPTGEVVCFGSGAGVLETYEDYGPYEKLIPLDSAVQLLSTTLSGYTDYTIDNIGLEYRTVYVGTDQPVETFRNGFPDLIGTMTVYASYEVFDLQPYWVFYTNHMEEYKQVMFFVNAITGEVKVIDNAY